jgi:hypothetical protein
MKKIIFFTLIVFGLFFWLPVGAQEKGGKVEVTPTIIDDKALASDILEYTLEIKNNTDRKVDLYAVVSDLTAEGGQKEFAGPGEVDKTISLARWIRISRGVIELMPGEKKELPLKIEVNLGAKPGLYHAVIAFGEGSNRPMAEGQARSGQAPQVLVNLEVGEQIVEKAQMKLFKTERPTYFQPPIKFIINLNNSGNRPIDPVGGVYIYDRRGALVDEIKVTSGQFIVAPGQAKEFNLQWEPKDRMGKFKAKLELEYGEKDKRDLQDTVYFWFLPRGWLVVFAFGLFVFIILLVWFLFKKTHHHHHPPYQPVGNGVLDLRGNKKRK